jgi:multiple sugar transport system permease protein
MGAVARRRRRGSLADSPRLLDAMVAAALAFILAFVGYPVFYNLLMSFQEVSLGNIRDLGRPFAGLLNYTLLIEDPAFWQVGLNTLVFTAANVILQVVLGFALALFFNLDFPGARWMRGLILAGWILPPLVIAAIFKWLFATNGGLVNEALMGAGLLARPATFLSDPASAMPIVIGTNVWFGMPFSMILLSAGLSNLPRDVYEAAAIDGAGPVQRFTRITLPLMAPTLFAVLCLSTIYTLRAFDVIWGMTGGGPVNATLTFPVWSFQFSFQQFAFGQGAAIATLMFVFVIGVCVVYIRSLRTEVRL